MSNQQNDEMTEQQIDMLYDEIAKLLEDFFDQNSMEDTNFLVADRVLTDLLDNVKMSAKKGTLDL